MNGKALGGVKVIEYCSMVAGPFCTKLLADLGAEVIKVEAPGTGDRARRRGPFPKDIPHPERSGLFLHLNTNKLGITLNTDKPTGRELLRRLLKDADIFVVDVLSASLEPMGMGYDSLKPLNPGLVMTSITPFGNGGPYQNYRACDVNIFQGSGGAFPLPGGGQFPERPPIKGSPFLTDYDSGLAAVIATLIAFYHRAVTGRGQLVDVSRLQSVITLHKQEMATYITQGTVETRKTRSARVGNMLPCKDGYFELVAPLPQQWENFLQFLGDPPWGHKEEFKDQASRSARAEEVNKLLVDWAKDHTREEIYHGSQSRRVPMGVVRTPGEVVNSPQMAHRGFFKEVDHPEVGRRKYPTEPMVLSETPVKLERGAPLLGQHNEEIYVGRMGYSREELAKMRRAGII